MKDFVRGYALAVLSGVLFGVSPIAAKFVYANGGTPIEILFLRAAAFVTPFFIARIRHCSLKTDRREFPKLAVLALLGGTITPLCTLTAFSLIPAGTATTIHYLYCAFILIGCVVFFKEKLSLLKTLCVALCLVGVVLLYAPDEAGSLEGILIAFISAVAYAAYSIFLEKSGLHKQNVLKLQFYIGLVSAVVIAAVFLPLGMLKFELTAAGWLVAIIYSAAGMICAALFYQKAVHYIGSQRTAILSTFEPLTGVVLGIVLYGESFDLRIGAGIIMILTAAATVTATRNRDSASKALEDRK